MKTLETYKIRDNIFKIISKEYKKSNKKLKLVIFHANNLSESKIYIKKKEEIGKKLGFKVKIIKISSDYTKERIIKLIKIENNKKSVNGIIIQHPIFNKINYKNLIKYISPYKDVEGITSKALVKTPILFSIIEIMKFYKINLQNKKICVLGNSVIVGQPIVKFLKVEKYDFVLIKKESKNYYKKIKEADVIFIGIGVPRFLKANFIKKGSIIFDIGFNQINNKIVGDVDFKNVIDKVKYITPVPKGIGALTVVSLFYNLIFLYNNYDF